MAICQILRGVLERLPDACPTLTDHCGITWSFTTRRGHTSPWHMMSLKCGITSDPLLKKRNSIWFEWGPAPIPPGFNAFGTNAWVAEWKAKAVPGIQNGAAPCFGHRLRRSGCFPALPYPPSWQPDNTTRNTKFNNILLINKRQGGLN